ncbi:hypothetical protein HGP14_09610 [Rhizobium sp. P32RR-XVIII]|uniref:hypothetical protein n=1 Tax=Rhizobium sp. P32RR-XVIII TaxID=2726738 RepID=UPI00145759D2|nr:hypothetical protein [Rhizobium sp. P32RR-XVIII]NLS03614.1 hypothetical protein [Rhizobium sp. P32RR-XVIII]
METMKVKPWSEDQGDHVLINKADFDPDKHILYGDGDSGGASVLRQDGPTVAEYVAAGYLASNYPPSGYASRSTPEEIDEAVAAQAVKTPAEVLAMATDTDVHFKTFQAEARKLLGENTPATKDEIVAALEALSQQ